MRLHASLISNVIKMQSILYISSLITDTMNNLKHVHINKTKTNISIKEH